MKDAKGTMETREYINGKLISHKKEEVKIKNEWKKDEICYKENLGIGHINPMYVEVNELQDISYEYKKVLKFLNKYTEYYSQKTNIPISNLSIEFLNYGKTELVYVLKIQNEPKFTLLVKQPAVIFGKIKQEADNLTELHDIDENVIAPIDYHSFGDQELYVTPYIHQARCVASYNTWGMYIPEPYYRFESFSIEQENIVNTCMIAKLISYYNFEKEEGISACKLGGGDFMLPKGWELEKPTIENTLNNLFFIAAREKTKYPFNDYLEFIRAEFSRVTIDEEQETLLINLRGRVKMHPQNIEDGIKLGLEIIANRNNNLTKKRVNNEKQK